MRKLWRSWRENLLREDLWPIEWDGFGLQSTARLQDLKRQNSQEREELDLGPSVNGNPTSAFGVVFLDVVSGYIFFKRNAPNVAVLNWDIRSTRSFFEKALGDLISVPDRPIVKLFHFVPIQLLWFRNLADRIPLKRPLHGALQGWKGVVRNSTPKRLATWWQWLYYGLNSHYFQYNRGWSSTQ